MWATAERSDVPGFGVRGDWGLAAFDITNVFHFSGGYELPFGKDKHFLHDAGKLDNGLVGGWSINWIVTLQGGQPITLNCPNGTTAGTGCYDMISPRAERRSSASQSTELEAYDRTGLGTRLPSSSLADVGRTNLCSDTRFTCRMRAFDWFWGFGLPSDDHVGIQDFNRSTSHVFKNIPITERFSLQFRAEFFNILNHPTFNAPGFGGNGVNAISNSTDFNATSQYL